MSNRPILQGIATKYIGPSNTKGSRIKATAAAGSVTIGYDHRLNPEENHMAAAHALATNLGWIENLSARGFELAQGGSPEGNGYIFVMVQITV